jgi:hypothetical protein
MYRLDKAVWAIFILRLLKLLHYFPNNNDEHQLGPEELLVARLAEHFLRVADDNCHEVCQVEPPTSSCSSLSDMISMDRDVDQVVVVIGVAIYLKISLFNNR